MIRAELMLFDEQGSKSYSSLGTVCLYMEPRIGWNILFQNVEYVVHSVSLKAIAVNDHFPSAPTVVVYVDAKCQDLADRHKA